MAKSQSEKEEEIEHKLMHATTDAVVAIVKKRNITDPVVINALVEAFAAGIDFSKKIIEKGL